MHLKHNIMTTIHLYAQSRALNISTYHLLHSIKCCHFSYVAIWAHLEGKLQRFLKKKEPDKQFSALKRTKMLCSVSEILHSCAKSICLCQDKVVGLLDVETVDEGDMCILKTKLQGENYSNSKKSLTSAQQLVLQISK